MNIALPNLRSRPALFALAIVVVACSALGGRASAAVGPRRTVKVTLDVRVKPAGSRWILAVGKVTPPPPVSGRVKLQVRRAGEAWGHGSVGAGHVAHGAYKVGAKIAGHVFLRGILFEEGKQIAISPTRSVRTRPAREAPPTGGGSPGATMSSGSTAGGGGTPPAAPTPSVDPLSAASLMATIDGYSALPNHLSGTPDSAAALDEFQGELAAPGLRLGEQAFTYPRFAIEAVGLSAGGTAVPAAAIAPLLYSGTTPAGGVTAPLFAGGSTAAGIGYTAGEVAGKIVVVSVPYEHNSKAVELDPAIETAVQGGAKGLIAVTQGVGDYPKWEDVNARRGTGPLPVLMVGKRSGAAVIAAAEAGEDGTLTLAADTTGLACDRDVWGELEGAEPDRRVFVGTPASSFTPSASEHGSGIAITVGLARHYASLPKAERPESLVFMALGGHEVGWLGLQALLASPQGAWFKEADAYVHLGSALGAPVATEEPDGTIVTTTTPDPTGRLHDSENPLLEASIKEDFAAAGVPTPETPPHTASGGEQTNAYAAGIPTVSFSGASLFFHTAGDLPGTVDPSILAKDADAFRRAVDTITAIPAGVLKAENANAVKLGTEIDADLRAPINPTKGSGQPGAILGSGGVGGPAATAVPQCP